MTFFFYDLETSGFSARSDRIMQFAGQRTDANLKETGEPYNLLIKLTPDVLPAPDAVLTHGITPQRTIEEGLSEYNFLKIFTSEIMQPDTVFVGYNNIRFDDEFMRFTLWRNFYDAYEWQWKDGASRWDLLDVARMTRALRPDGIKWPKTDAGNSLVNLAKLNKLEHTSAHDAASDVEVLIDLARLIKTKQSKLFGYMLKLRSKNQLEPFIKAGKPFVYTSGRYPKELLHTTVAAVAATHPEKSSVLVFDLRVKPKFFVNKTAEELAKLWLDRGEQAAYFPVKELAFNRCAAVAPTSVLDEPTQKRLELNLAEVEANAKELKAAKNFGKNLVEALRIVEQTKQNQYAKDSDVDAQLYDGFLNDSDRARISAVRAAAENVAEFKNQFKDGRLNKLLPLYKARNWPQKLSPDEQAEWHAFCTQRLAGDGPNSATARFFERLNQLANQPLTKEQQFLLEELNLYAQSILPTD